MNYFIILSALVLNGIWAQSRFKKMAKSSMSINCMSDEQCVKYQGYGICKNLTCVCENEEECKSRTPKVDVKFKSNMIGEPCTEDHNCNIQYSVCKDGFCECNVSRVASGDHRKCLEVSEGLGKNCSEDSQCVKIAEGSTCKDSICVCDEIHHQIENSTECFENVALGQACKENHQCNHIAHAKCGLIKCECDSGYIESASRKKCLRLAAEPLGECEESVQCKLFNYGGICIHGKCECDKVHRVANLTACPSRLKQVCVDDNECKSDADDPTIHCEMGRCECSPPYTEENGYCNGCGIQRTTLFSIVGVLIVILNVK